MSSQQSIELQTKLERLLESAQTVIDHWNSSDWNETSEMDSHVKMLERSVKEFETTHNG